MQEITSDKYNVSCQWLNTIAYCKTGSPGCYSSIEFAQVNQGGILGPSFLLYVPVWLIVINDGNADEF